MHAFRKKPVEIIAWQFNGDDRIDWPEPWASEPSMRAVLHPRKARLIGIEITTLEGVMVANVGDWVIRGTAGEFYPCKPDIFAAIYEKV